MFPNSWGAAYKTTAHLSILTLSLLTLPQAWDYYLLLPPLVARLLLWRRSARQQAAAHDAAVAAYHGAIRGLIDLARKHRQTQPCEDLASEPR